MLGFFQEGCVAISVVGGQDFGVDGAEGAASAGVAYDGVREIGVQHADHGFQGEPVAVEVLEGIQVVQAFASVGCVVFRIRVAQEEFWDFTHEVEVHVGVAG